MKEWGRIMVTAALGLGLGLGSFGCSDWMGGSNDSSGSSVPKTTVSATGGEMQKPTDTSSGPAFRTVSGKVKKVDDPYYDVEEYSGNMVRLHVNNKTIKINGDKKVGDSIRAEITRGGHANSIQ